MPTVTAYSAYSSAVAVPVRHDVPDTVTAHKLKRVLGHDAADYLFVRLPKHEFTRGCACFFCVNWRRHFMTRPSWLRQDVEYPGWWAWQRHDIGAKNSRLKLMGGEHFVVVAECDIDQWLDELCGRGRLGMMLGLALVEARVHARMDIARSNGSRRNE